MYEAINADTKTSSGSKFISLKASFLILSSPLTSSSLLQREVWKYFKSSSLANLLCMMIYIVLHVENLETGVNPSGNPVNK